MNIEPNPNFDLTLNTHARIMGIDVGTKTLGIAFTCLGFLNAIPHCIIKRSKYKNDLSEIKNIIHDWQIQGLVFGLPLNMNGSSGARVQATKTIARNIARDTDLNYCFIDERLSTDAATNRLIAIGIKPSDRKKIIDAQAAAIILENYHFYLRNRKI